MYMYRNSVRLLYFVHWVTMNCGFQNGSAFQNGSLEWNFRMEVHSRVEFQNGNAFQSGISEFQNGSAFQNGNSEWKCIPEWNIYVELNGPYGLPYNTLTIDWDSENNVTNVKERVALIRKGCNCKTGCSTARCKCKKSNFQCGPGCKCLGCTNLPIEAVGQSNAESVDSSDDSSTESDLDNQVDQLMVDIFGNSYSDTDDYFK